MADCLIRRCIDRACDYKSQESVYSRSEVLLIQTNSMLTFKNVKSRDNEHFVTRVTNNGDKNYDS